jgi:hypothetical protein
LSRRRKTEAERNWDRIRKQLADELHCASIFAAFMLEAQNRGYVCKIHVEVDGVDCQVRVLVKGNDNLIEYLANWACASKIVCRVNLDEFDKLPKDGGGADANGAK